MSEQQPDGCTGPHSSAFDCPVHDPRRAADSPEAARPAQGTTPTLTTDEQAIKEYLCIDFENEHWWTYNDEGEVECDSFAEAVIKTVQFKANDIEALRKESLDARTELHRVKRASEAPSAAPMTRESLEQAVREAFGQALLPSIVAVLVNELSKALAPVVAAPAEALIAACEPYLKDGETPAECIARNRGDIDALMTLYRQALEKAVDDEAMIEQLCRDLNAAHNEILKLQGVAPEDYDKYDWPNWSGPANSLRWASRRLGKRVGKTDGTNELPAPSSGANER